MKYIILLFIFFDIVFSIDNKQVGNLIMENVPDIPLDISEQSRKYRNTRSASCRSWLRDGSGMIIGTRFGETSQLHMLNMPMGSRNQITFFDEPISGGYMSPDPRTNGFLFSRDNGGNEFYQIYFYNLDDGSVTLLTDGESRNSLGPWSKNGDRFAFTSNMGNGVDMNVYISDLDGNQIKVVSENGYWFPRSWHPNGNKLIVGSMYPLMSHMYI